MTATSVNPPQLLATKLFVPRTRQTIVPRPQLAARLAASLTHPLTLISAPAGFGKTTMVSTWARSQPQAVAWLALDEGDNDPTRFLSYLVAALQRVNPALGQGVQSALAASSPPPPAAAITALINDLAAAEGEILLVLDDFHLVDATPIHEAVALLVTHQPPQLHLMLVTREDPQLPLARLRARGELVELRAQDLRFSPAEAAQFIHEVMGLALDEQAMAALDARIEGWAAGLQLAALSLQNSDNPAALIAGLTGNHHFILSYLTEEVLHQLSPARQSFLLETALLTRLNGDLCDAVTGRAGSAAVLEELEAANVFVIPLDDERRWYRYHHLFADLLRHQLRRTMPERASTLQQRASAWYETQGDAIEAIDYALAAEDYVRAVRLLENHARAVVLQGYAQTVASWLSRLPEAWRMAGPRTNLAFGWSLLLRGQLDEIEPYLRDAEVAGAETATAAIQAEALALRAGLASLRGDPERSRELARAAVALAPADDLYVQSMTTFCLGAACNYAGRDAEAIATYRAALPLCEAAGNRVAAMLIVGNLTMLYSARGQLHAAADLCLATISAAAHAGLHDSPALAVVYGGYGDLLYAWNDLDGAQEQVTRALDLSRRSGHVAALAYSNVVQSRLLQARGDLTGAAQALEQAIALRRRGMPAWVAPHIVSQQVALALARSDLAAAEQALLQTGVAATDPLHHTREVIQIAHLRLRLHQGRDQNSAQLDDADELALRILASAAPADRMGRVLEVLLLRGQMSHAQGDVDAACADVMQALTLGESEGYVRVFVAEGEALRVLLGAVRRKLTQQAAELGPSPAYVDKVLAAFPHVETAARSGPITLPPLVEPLTERELEVLRLMAQGLTYDEVAQQLIVSLNTVRYHVKGLYGKLGVDKRMAAIEQAKAHGLL